MRPFTFVLLTGISLFSYPSGLPVSIADVALLAWVLYSILFLKRISFSVIPTLGIVWYGSALLSGLFIGAQIHSTPFLFSTSDFFLSLARSTLGIGVILTVRPIVEAVGSRWTVRSILSVIRVHAVLVLLGLVLFNLIGTGAGLKVIVTGQDQVRSSGLFGEPAWFGWFTGTCLFIVANFQKKTGDKMLSTMDYILFLGAVGLGGKTLSGLLCVGGGLLACTFYTWRARRSLILILLAIAIAGSLVYQSAPLTLKLNQNDMGYLQKRIVRASLGKDGSVIARFNGSILRTEAILSEAPLSGSGLGNNVKSARAIKLPRTYQRIQGSATIHILPLAAFATTGLIGGCIYILILGTTLRKPSEWTGVGLVLLSASYGGFLLGVIWWFIGFADFFQNSKA